MTQAPPVEAAEQALAEARNLVVFAYTVDFIPMNKIFSSRQMRRGRKRVTRGMTRQAAQAPETLMPIVVLRSKAHPGYFAVAWGVHLLNAAKMAHLEGLWAVIADKWVEVA